MMNYIKSQSVSDEAEPTISTVFIIGVTIVAAIWLFSRLFASTERKGADVSNCIAGSSNLTPSTAGATTSTTCNDNNSNADHEYNYGHSLR